MLISYIGLSHLSLNYSASALIYKNKVQIFDKKEIINNYIDKKLNFYEPNLDDTFKKYYKKVCFTFDFNKLLKSDLIFVAVDVLTNNFDKVSYDRLNNLINDSLKIIKNSKIPLIIMSQVEPGFTRKIKYDFRYLYHYVETLVFGNALFRATNPERIIIGKQSNNFRESKKLINFLNNYKCEIIQMTYEESELTKTFINIYLASQLITTNNLSNISRSLNCDWNKIKNALRLDKRIGNYSYINPGLGISGGNIERDIKTLKDLSSDLGLKRNFFNLLINDNRFYKNWLFRCITKHNYRNKKIGILGITYKEDTLSCKNAASIEIIKNLTLNKVFLHDRRLKNLNLPKKILNRFFDLKYIIKNCNCLIVLHNINTYKKINFNQTNISMIIDPFKILKENNNKIRYLSLIDSNVN
ncbi:hypothetical protein OA517_02155 [Alphaproteobacteria bacterium]|nr:hypothetical protein [Alphaproteobacteria bacterium]